MNTYSEEVGENSKFKSMTPLSLTKTLIKLFFFLYFLFLFIYLEALGYFYLLGIEKKKRYKNKKNK